MRSVIDYCLRVSLCVLAAASAATAQTPTDATEGGSGRLPEPPLESTKVVEPSSAPAPSSSGTAAPVAAAEPTGVVPGAMEEQRKALLEKIGASRRLGFGVAPYMAAFNQIEQMVKTGAPQDALQKRINSVRSSLLEQAMRMKDIKERPQLPPGAVSSQQSGAGAGGATAAAGGGKQQLLDQLKQKYGDQLNNPEVRDKLANPDLRQKLMDSPLGQKLIEKLQNQ